MVNVEAKDAAGTERRSGNVYFRYHSFVSCGDAPKKVAETVDSVATEVAEEVDSTLDTLAAQTDSTVDAAIDSVKAAL